MKDTEYAFCVAAVKEKENTLPSSDFLSQLISAQNYSTALKILKENPITDLNNEWDFLMDIVPDKEALKFLIIKNDFHNLKVAIKAVCFEKNPENLFLSPSVLEPKKLYNIISERNFFELPEWISQISEKGYDILTSTLDGQIFEMYVDINTISVIKAFSKKTKSRFCENMCEELSCVYNIKAALRISEMTESEKRNIAFEYAFAPCKKLDNIQLKKAAEKSKDDVLEYIRKTDYSFFEASISKSMAQFEKEAEDYIFMLTEEAKRISFGIEPIIAYYMYIETVTKNIGIILSCKKFGEDQSVIKERLRNLYV